MSRAESIGGRPRNPAKSFRPFSSSSIVCASSIVDRRHAQGHVIQRFDPHAAEAGHNNRPEQRITTSSNDQLDARFRLPLQERWARAQSAKEILERLGDGGAIHEAQAHGAGVALVN